MDSEYRRIIGMEVCAKKVRAVVLGLERGKWRVQRFSEVPLPEGRSIKQALEEAVGEVGEALVVSAVPSQDLLTRQLQLEVPKQKDVEAVRNFQVEPLLPFGVEEAVLQHQYLEQEGAKRRIVVLSLLKQRLAEHLDRLKGGGIEPEKVSCVPAALARLIYYLLPSDQPVAILHLDGESTTCMIAHGGAVRSSRVVAFGATHLQEVVPSDRPVDFMNFEATHAPFVKKRAERFRSEVAKTLLSIMRLGAVEGQASQLFVTGEFDAFRNFDVYLGEALELPIAHLPLRTDLSQHEFRISRFAAPLGLALGALPRQKAAAVDFRREELAYPHPFRRSRKRLATYFTLCLAAASLVFFAGKGLLVGKVRDVRQEYQQLTRLMGDPDPDPALSPEEMLHAAEAASRRVAALPKTFPLSPDVPRVGDLLAWLATLPQMEGIRIERLRYLLSSYPEQKRPGERYRAKVELEFSANSPTQARELHDALLAPNQFVDQTLEVQWAVNQGSIRASFALQDRTSYPKARL